MPLPETGFLRLNQIIGNTKKGVPALIPIGRNSWYEGIKQGIYPPQIKLGEKTAVYRVEDIQKLIDRISSGKPLRRIWNDEGDK